MKKPFAMIGAGAMGCGILHRAPDSPFHPVAVYDRAPPAIVRAREMLSSGHARDATCLTGSADEFLRLTEHAAFLVDSSSAVYGTRDIINHFLDTGRPVFMMNSEADLVHGPEFLARAQSRGVLYSSVDGDQHGVIKRLADRVSSWGLRLVMLGNIKGFLDRRATPTSIVGEARARDLDPVMCCAYTDGTKLAVEMALLSNAMDARAIVRGMTGPAIEDATRVAEHFDLDRIWDGGRPIVDYVLGARPHGGVFVVGHTDDAYQRKLLAYYKMGDGPYYVFVRPFHLCHLETLPAIDEALRTSTPLLAPVHGRVSNVFAMAKRGLHAGDVLDGHGGAMCYGVIDDESPATADLLPICESAGYRLAEDVAEDSPVLRSRCTRMPDWVE